MDAVIKEFEDPTSEIHHDFVVKNEDTTSDGNVYYEEELNQVQLSKPLTCKEDQENEIISEQKPNQEGLLLAVKKYAYIEEEDRIEEGAVKKEFTDEAYSFDEETEGKGGDLWYPATETIGDLKTETIQTGGDEDYNNMLNLHEIVLQQGFLRADGGLYSGHMAIGESSKPTKSQSERKYKCEECGKLFIRSGHLVKHRRVHTGEKPFACEECGRAFAQEIHLANHQRIHTGMKSFVCEQCDKSFARLDNLIDHKRLHAGIKPFACKDCGRTFSRAHHLATHRRIHTGETPFKCEECGKSFRYLSSFTYHRGSHAGNKPFYCETCGKAFQLISHLTNHQRIHTGEKPYVCQDCGKSFARSHHLSFHQRTHTGEKTYTCEECGKAFTNSSNRNKHRRIHASSNSKATHSSSVVELS